MLLFFVSLFFCVSLPRSMLFSSPVRQLGFVVGWLGEVGVVTVAVKVAATLNGFGFAVRVMYYLV